MDFICGATNSRFEPFHSSIEHPKIAEKIHPKDTYIHTYFIGSSPRGFSESILHYKIINQVHDMTLPNGVEIKFEEIIGLTGDLCGLPENPIIDPFFRRGRLYP